MGFILDGLDTESYDRTYSDRELVQRIVSYFRPHAGRMILVGVMIALNSTAGTGGPILISRALDLIQRRSALQVILLLASGVLLMEVAAWSFNYVRQWFSAQVVGT